MNPETPNQQGTEPQTTVPPVQQNLTGSPQVASQPAPAPVVQQRKTPLAAQVIFALGICALIIFSLIAVVLFMSGLPVEAVIFVVVGILDFMFASFLRRGKLWALISLSTLAGLGLTGSIATQNIPQIIVQLLYALLFVNLWLKHRAYFGLVPKA